MLKLYYSKDNKYIIAELYNKYNKNVRVTAIFDKDMILPYKSSPIDEGPQVFEKLLNERIIPNGK